MTHQSFTQLRHDLMQPASVAVMALDELKRRNCDHSLKVPLELLENALKDLAEKIESLS
jgi:hypothetical protein